MIIYTRIWAILCLLSSVGAVPFARPPCLPANGRPLWSPLQDLKGFTHMAENQTIPYGKIEKSTHHETSMDTITKTHIQNIDTTDRDVQNKAYAYVMEATSHPVPWAYAVWDEMVALLKHKDNHQRAIAAQVLCNLAKSDPDGRIFNDFEALLTVTKDERFVTARHCLQSLWKIGTVGKAEQGLVMDGLERRFRECGSEKNGTLIRYDILQGMKHLYDATEDETIRAKALALIEMEEDPKYRKKYATVWKPVKRTA